MILNKNAVTHDPNNFYDSDLNLHDLFDNNLINAGRVDLSN